MLLLTNLSKTLLGVLFLAAMGSCTDVQQAELSSLDGQYRIQVKTNEGAGLSYEVTWNEEPLILESALGFQIADGSLLTENVKIGQVERNTVDEQWTPVFGERSSYPDQYNEMVISLSAEGGPIREFDLRVRAYQEGVAFRYEFRQDEDLEVDSELTEFSLQGDPYVWVSERSQASIEKLRLSELEGPCERPFLAQLSASAFVALGEAACVDFAAMRLLKKENASGKLRIQLQTQSLNESYPIHIYGRGYSTPWRFVMAGSSPSEILQNNYLLLSLNEENQIEDPSWITPGKVIREVTLTTQGGKACVDFAEKHQLQYIEYDGGWYGDPHSETSDARTVTPDPKRSSGPLDMEEVIRYGKEKGIGVILYVDRRELERRLDELLPLYQSWGVAGMKFGFVQVGPQHWTRWLHDAIKKAADYGMIVDVHDKYRPTGFSRTYPNYLTMEGIRGDEESPPNNMVINTIYTRMIAGAGDHTICYFNSRVDEKMGSHTAQMAKSICVYSPLQFLYWYDRPQASPARGGEEVQAVFSGVIQEIPDLEFFDQLPTVWDDTKIIDGYPGKLAVIARKKGDHWFLGALTGTEGKDLQVKLDFLDPGRPYRATIYSDDSTLNTLTQVRISESTVGSNYLLEHSIPKQNGLAMIIKPETE